MDSDTIWMHIDRQRGEVADLLDGLSAAQWSSPSLCAGWTVRDVAAHLTQSQAGVGESALAALRYGFRFNVMMHRLAVSDTRSPMELTAALRAMAGSRRRPPGTTDVEPLMDALVHGQDIAVPLGIDLVMPTAPAVVVANRLWHMRFPFRPSRTLAGMRFAATDADFAVGDGRRIDAPVRDIVMMFAGRQAPVSGAVAGPASDSD